jgi:hypothetical protein
MVGAFQNTEPKAGAMIEVKCSQCGAKLAAPPNLAGKTGKCPKCGELFRMPNGTVAATPAKQAPLAGRWTEQDQQMLDQVMADAQRELNQAAAATRDAEPDPTPLAEPSPTLTRARGGGRTMSHLPQQAGWFVRKKPQWAILIIGLSLAGLACLFPPVVSLDGPGAGQSAGRRFLFAMEFSKEQIEKNAVASWTQSQEGMALLDQERKAEDAKAEAFKAKALDAEEKAFYAWMKVSNKIIASEINVERKAVADAIASRDVFSGIVRARDYGGAFLECIGILALTAIAFLWARSWATAD